MTRSEELFEKAKHLIPGGVNSPVRAFGSVGECPRFIAKARGTQIWDVDGNRDPCTCIDLDPCQLYETCPIVEDPLREAI